MMNKEVSVVLINYNRPDNIYPIVESWFTQEEFKPFIILINAPKDDSCDLRLRPFAKLTESMVDVMVSMPNIGGYTRYMVAPLINTPYALFADDDFLPNKRALSHYVSTAKSMNNRFACLGELGRHVPADLTYTNRDILQSNTQKRVDYLCRIYFYNSRHLPLLDAQRRSVFSKFKYPREDDIVAQAIIQMQTGLNSYLVPLTSDPERLGIGEELDDTGGLRYQPEHGISRAETVRHLASVGWQVQSRSKTCKGCG